MTEQTQQQQTPPPPPQDEQAQDKFASFLPEQLAKSMKNPKYVDRLQQLIKGCKIEFSEGELQIIAAKCPDITSNIDFAEFIYYCAKQGLNPILNEAHLEYKNSQKYGPRAIKVVHFDAYKKALVGQHNGFKQVEGFDPNCAIARLKDPTGKNPLSGYYVDTILYLKGIDNPIESRAYYLEYAGTDMYTNKPYTMLSKVSFVRTCRLAGVLEDSYSQEEADAWVDTGAPATVVVTPAPSAEDFNVGQKPAETKTALEAPKEAAKKEEPKEAPPTETQPPPAETKAPEPDTKPAETETEPPKAETKSAPVETAPPPPERPKLKQRNAVIQANLKLSLEQFNDSFYKLFAGFFGVPESQLPPSKENLDAYHTCLDRVEAALKSENAIMVKQYVTDDPETLGKFLAGTMVALPLLPGFMPPKPPVTTEEIYVMFGKHGWDDVLCRDIAQYCTERGLEGKEITARLKSLNIGPKSGIELIKLYIKVDRISQNAFPILAERAKDSGKPLAEWVAYLEKQLNKSLANCTQEELDMAITELPESIN